MISYSQHHSGGGFTIEFLIIAVTVLIVLLIVAFMPSAEEIASLKGAKGESKVSSILQSLPDGYHVVNNVIIPTRNATSQIDHVLVSVYGVFVIETKNYSGWIFGSDNSKKWKQTFPKSSHYFYNPIKQNWAHIYAFSDFLKLDKRVFKPVIVFSDDASLNVQSRTPVINMSCLRSHILSYTQEILSPENAEKIYNNIRKINLVGTDAGNKHTETVKQTISKEKASIAQGKCPRCGGNLKLRNGKYGKFYGCSNYPRCRFTHDV